MYQLKGGERVTGGMLHGWTGKKCPSCSGHGSMDDSGRACPSCGGTGDEYAVMPEQPADLPLDTE